MSNLPTRTSDTIDYIRFVMPYQYGVTGVLPMLSDFGNYEGAGIIEKGFYGYTRTRLLDTGIQIMWNENEERLGICVQASGKALAHMNAGILAPSRLLRWSVENGARLKRVDYALDLVGDSYIAPAELKNAVVNREIDYLGHSWQWVEKTPKSISTGGGYGSTLYLGSRSSNRFLRYYDKAAQQKILGVSWSRLEIELKNERAQQYGEECCVSDWMEKGRGQIFDYIKTVNKDSGVGEWLENLKASRPFELPREIPRPDGKPDEFVEKIVLPFLRHHAEKLSDRSILSMRTLLHGEILAREANERNHDSEFTIDKNSGTL